MSYGWLYEQLDEALDYVAGEIHDLKEIAEVKPKDADLAARIEWLEEARGYVAQALDAVNGAIGVS